MASLFRATFLPVTVRFSVPCDPPALVSSIRPPLACLLVDRAFISNPCPWEPAFSIPDHPFMFIPCLWRLPFGILIRGLTSSTSTLLPDYFPPPFLHPVISFISHLLPLFQPPFIPLDISWVSVMLVSPIGNVTSFLDLSPPLLAPNPHSSSHPPSFFSLIWVVPRLVDSHRIAARRNATVD